MERETRKYKKHKQGYTISVSYFLRKEKGLTERIFEDKIRDPLKLPLHVRVTFLGQNVKIRSRIKAFILENEYDDFINNSDVKQLIHYETESIKYAIELFEPDQKGNFLISSWANFYKKWDEPISNCIRESMAFRLQSGLQTEFQIPSTDIMELILTQSTIFAESIDYYVHLRSDTALRLQDQMQSIAAVPTTAVIKYKSDIIDFNYSYWDWKSGTYTNLVRNTTKPIAFEYFEHLMSDYQKLKQEI